MYTDPEEVCRYHPGPPIFHEGQKGKSYVTTPTLHFISVSSRLNGSSADQAFCNLLLRDHPNGKWSGIRAPKTALFFAQLCAAQHLGRHCKEMTNTRRLVF